MATSANMFYIAIGDKNKTNMKLAASNRNIKIHQLFSKQRIFGVALVLVTTENLSWLDKNLLLNNIHAIIVKITMKLILIFLSNSCFNSLRKMKKISLSIF